MKRQRSMAQMKEQIKTPEKELNEMEISNLSDTDFRQQIMSILKEFSRDVNSIKKIQSDTKDTVVEVKNYLQGNNSRVDEAKNQISDLEYKEAKNNQSEQQKGKRIPQNEDSVSRLWDNFKQSNICIMLVSEGEEKEQEFGNTFEKIMK